MFNEDTGQYPRDRSCSAWIVRKERERYGHLYFSHGHLNSILSISCYMARNLSV